MFVTNYQPSLLRKFRIEWEDLCEANRRLIYALITGYGERGEDADAPAYDGLAYWARSGLMTSVTGADGTPAGAWANSVDIQAKLCGARFPQRKAGERPINPLVAAYPSSDHHAMIIALLDPEREFSRLCRALGEPELADNPLFATTEARKENAAALYAVLQSQFEAKPLGEWRRLFREHDVKWSPLPTLDEAVRDPQMRDCGAIVSFDYPGVGRIETVDSPVFVLGSEKRTPAPPPAYGAHTRAILTEAGFSASDVERLIESGVAVQGGK